MHRYVTCKYIEVTWLVETLFNISVECFLLVVSGEESSFALKKHK